jgi:hypothetical protein
MVLERSGYVSGWRSPEGHLAWCFRLRQPGLYRVHVQTFMDRDRAHMFQPHGAFSHYYGDHRLRVRVAGTALSGLVGRKDLVLDETVNRWHTAESDLGEVELPAAGLLELELGMDELDASAELGPTVCGVRLVPVDRAA